MLGDERVTVVPLWLDKPCCGLCTESVIWSDLVCHVQFAVVVEAVGHDLRWSVLAGAFVLFADANHCLKSGKTAFGFCTLLYDLWLLARKDFEFFICQVGGIPISKDQVRQVPQQDTLNDQRSNIVDEGVQSDLSLVQQ